MIGAIIGDIIGSYYEWRPTKSKGFDLFPPGSSFTDDTVTTIAIADAILNNKDYGASLQEWGRKYPNAGYGRGFKKWLQQDNPLPYNSYGNGAAMRVCPIGYAFDTIDEVLENARLCAMASHDHPEGIKGAQAVSLTVFMARIGAKKSDIKHEISNRFTYDLNRSIDKIRPLYKFEVSCQKSVPEAIIAFLESSDFEDAIRNAISLGGDSDTQACIAGAIAEAYYKAIPEEIVNKSKVYLDSTLLKILEQFMSDYQCFNR
jgi:ADP-ribosylglycohydrolase